MIAMNLHLTSAERRREKMQMKEMGKNGGRKAVWIVMMICELFVDFLFLKI